MRQHGEPRQPLMPRQAARKGEKTTLSLRAGRPTFLLTAVYQQPAVSNPRPRLTSAPLGGEPALIPEERSRPETTPTPPNG